MMQREKREAQEIEDQKKYIEFHKIYNNYKK